MIQIRRVAEGPNGMLRKMGLETEQASMLLDYIDENKKRFYNLSLRLVTSVAQAFLADPERWQDDIEATRMKTRG
jgi:hypothetical protein